MQAQGVAFAAAGAVNAFRVAQGTTAVGLRYDVDARWALKLQWDHVRIKADAARLWTAPLGPVPASRADVGSVVLDFVF
jgi:hypothetical protein